MNNVKHTCTAHITMISGKYFDLEGNDFNKNITHSNNVLSMWKTSIMIICYFIEFEYANYPTTPLNMGLFFRIVCVLLQLAYICFKKNIFSSIINQSIHLSFIILWLIIMYFLIKMVMLCLINECNTNQKNDPV